MVEANRPAAERRRPLYGQPMTEGRSCPACGGPLSPWRTVPASDPVLRAGRVSAAALRGLRNGGHPMARIVALRPARPGPTGPSRPTSTNVARTGPETPGCTDSFAHCWRALTVGGWPCSARSCPHQLASWTPERAGDSLVAAANLAGYDAFGLEPSPRGGEAAGIWRERIQRTGLEEAEIEPGSLDAVTLWHVLEHLEDPPSALERIRGWPWLPGGRCWSGFPTWTASRRGSGGSPLVPPGRAPPPHPLHGPRPSPTAGRRGVLGPPDVSAGPGAQPVRDVADAGQHVHLHSVVSTTC